MLLKVPMKAPRGSGLVRALSWFSIGLGVAELVAPKAVARITGMHTRDAALVRACGVREVATGLGLLKSTDPVPWLWGRVLGDAMDIATVGVRGRRGGSGFGLTLAALAGVAALDFYATRRTRAQQVSRPLRDYSDRSGFPRPVEQMRGAARAATVRPQGQPAAEPARSVPPSVH